MVSTDQGKTLRVLLTSPPQPVRVSIGDSFSVSVLVRVKNVAGCRIQLKFDGTVFEETSGQPNPRVLAGEDLTQEVGWWLQVKTKPVLPSLIVIEAQANDLRQQSQFEVEVAE